MGPLSRGYGIKKSLSAVLASGLGCYYLDGTSFLNTLCKCVYRPNVYIYRDDLYQTFAGHHGSSFERCLSSSIISDIRLLCRCIGEHSTVTCCNVNTTVSPPVVQENVIPRPSHFNPATILATFKVSSVCGTAVVWQSILIFEFGVVLCMD